MTLTGADIKQYIKYGGLRFEPELEPNQFQQNGVDLVLAETKLLVEGPIRFSHGVTRERITMPNDLKATVGIRSTWARKGIGMHGVTFIDAGFVGDITLEIIWFAALNTSLPVGKRF